MSFLAVPEEDTDIFAETIAFIDSIDRRLGPEPIYNTHNSQRGDCIDSTSPRSTSTRKPSPRGYSTRFQQQRVQAHTRGTSSLDQQADMIQAKVQKAAEIECRDRQRSEEVNRRLQALLAHQKKIQKALCEKLPRKSFTQGSDFDEKTQASGAIVAQLEGTVTKLYKDSPSVLHAYPPTTHSSMKNRRDEARGEFVEILSTTPLSCQASSAADFAWKNLTAHYPCAVDSARSASQPQGNSHAKSWTCNLKSEPDGKLLECTQFLRKFDEPNRCAIASASVMETPKGGTRFCSQSTATITCSAANPNASVVRVCG